MYLPDNCELILKGMLETFNCITSEANPKESKLQIGCEAFYLWANDLEEVLNQATQEKPETP